MNSTKGPNNYDTYYAHYSNTQSLLMALICAFSNLASIPLVIRIFQLKQDFVGLMAFMSAFSSFMYHLTEIFNWTLFLNFSEWHRLDNVFAVTGFSIYMVLITGNIANRPILYSTLIVAILAQEKDPWNLAYTIGPIVIYFLVGVASNVYFQLGMPKYSRQNILKGSAILLVGVYFFVKGLDEHTDYLRFNHGMWHIFLGIASWYNFKSVPWPDPNSYTQVDRDDKD